MMTVSGGPDEKWKVNSGCPSDLAIGAHRAFCQLSLKGTFHGAGTWSPHS